MFKVFESERRLSDLAERVETLERNLKGLKLEWSDVLDRMSRMKQRIMKAERDAAARGDTADTGNLSDEEVANGVNSLTERARAANAAILARRQRNQ
jgi:predicted  nucleic acid-binding Zn-ribbon protein